MTYAGFEQDEIQDQMDHINRIKDEYENLTPEEKSIRICTLEKLMERLMMIPPRMKNQVRTMTI